ncbi:hypothetical protein D3C78_604480 [compost metagenome]
MSELLGHRERKNSSFHIRHKFPAKRIVPVQHSRIRIYLIGEQLCFGIDIILHAPMIIQVGLRNIQQTTYFGAESLRTFELEAAEFDHHPVILCSFLRSLTERRANVTCNNRIHTCSFQHLTYPGRRCRLAIGSRDANHRRCTKTVSNLYLCNYFNAKLKSLLHRRRRIRNAWVLNDQTYTFMNQSIRMPTAYNTNSQRFQFGSFGTLISFLFIVHRNYSASIMQHFSNLDTAFCEPKNHNFFTTVHIWMFHSLQPLANK